MPKETAYCWAHVDDVARGHILAMEKGKTGESYIIAGEYCTFIDALRLAEKITGIPAPKLLVPPAALRVAARLMGVIEKVVWLPETYRSETLRISAGVTYIGDNAKARRELGYDPRPLEEGLRELLTHEMRLLGMSIAETKSAAVG
jgi:nucleoside-diphosphate-sugar epimerase